MEISIQQNEITWLKENYPNSFREYVNELSQAQENEREIAEIEETIRKLNDRKYKLLAKKEGLWIKAGRKLQELFLKGINGELLN